MKKSIKTILVCGVLAIASFALAACGGDGKPAIPPNNAFDSVGIPGGFTAEVKGTLVSSASSADEGVQMKWSGSDEASHDNVIAWLRGGGYDKYGGQTAQKESMPDGSYTVYSAEKTVSGTETEASAIYFYRDTTIGGELLGTSYGAKAAASITAAAAPSGFTFKANELYMAIEPIDDGGSPLPNTPVTEWPVAAIQQVLGTALPAYTGVKTSYSVVSNTVVYPIITITVNGSAQGDLAGYNALLASNGFTYSSEDESYAKTLPNGDVVKVQAHFAGSVIIIGTLEKNSGSTTTWPGSTLNSRFSGITIPAFSGASSFDVSDQSVTLPVVGLVPVVLVTAYGADAAKINTYKTALTNAGYALSGGDYIKNAPNDKVMHVNIDGISDTRVLITFSLGDPESGYAAGYTLPTNVKAVRNASGITYTAIKIGDDYYGSYEYGSTVMAEVFYKHNAGVWTEYEKTYSSWEPSGETYNASEMAYEVEGTYLFDFMTDSYYLEDLAPAGTDTVAGVAVNVYTGNLYGMGTVTYYIDPVSKLLFKETMTGSLAYNYEVTLWDTTVTGFGAIVLPS
ncbi:MAG: hypothetical protein LBS99_03125 [Clostridiales bacterium]|jgi:hypothetical protein|nr:hypothetical protein [Clostridiales bacterium]